jgi:hypothetical protein
MCRTGPGRDESLSWDLGEDRRPLQPQEAGVAAQRLYKRQLEPRTFSDFHRLRLFPVKLLHCLTRSI